MKCNNCGRSVGKGFGKGFGMLKHLGPLCAKCFKGVLHRRIRREFRKYPWFKPNEKVVLVKETHPRFALLKEAFKLIIKGMPIKLKEQKISIEKASKSYDRVIVAWTAEHEIQAFLREVFENVPRKPEPKNLIKPLKHITNDEVALYAKAKGLKMPHDKGKLKALIDRFEKKYPGTKFALLESIEELGK